MSYGRTTRTVAGLALGWLALASCTSLSDYRYGPSPQDHELLEEGTDALLARVQVAVRGIRERSEGEPVLRFRLRVENPLDAGVVLVPELFQLVDGTLTAFGAAEIVPEPPTRSREIEPGGVAVFDVAFPFPSGVAVGDLDLSSFNFRWGIEFPRGEVAASAHFERLVRGPAGYEPYPYAGFGHYGGFGIHARFHIGD